jgi:hypothetical protein
MDDEEVNSLTVVLQKRMRRMEIYDTPEKRKKEIGDAPTKRKKEI